MKPKILIIYSTTDGHTLRICDRLMHVMAQQDCQVQVLPLAQATSADLAGCDCIVVGASIRYGKHQPAVAQFIESHLNILTQKTVHSLQSISWLASPRRTARTPTRTCLSSCDKSPGGPVYWVCLPASWTIRAMVLLTA